MGTADRVQFDLAAEDDDHRTSIRTGADEVGKTIDLQALSDSDLTHNLKLLVAARQRCTAVILAHLNEFERRDLPQRRSYPSLFAYCVKELGFTEDVACRHIIAARAIKRFPSILGFIARGELGLTTLGLLSRHLTAANHRSLLGWAAGKSKREVERKAAEIAGPSALVARDVIRPQIQPRQPDASPSEPAAPLLDWTDAAAAAPLNPAATSEGSDCAAPGPDAPEAPGHTTVFRLAFTCSQDVMLMLERAKALLEHNSSPAVWRASCGSSWISISSAAIR